MEITPFTGYSAVSRSKLSTPVAMADHEWSGGQGNPLNQLEAAEFFYRECGIRVWGDSVVYHRDAFLVIDKSGDRHVFKTREQAQNYVNEWGKEQS